MNNIIIIGAILAFLSVALGAMGAHLLKNSLDAYALGIFDTAAQYQMYHALAMILTGLSFPHVNNTSLLKKAAWIFFSAIVLFCGSLYILSLTGIKQWAMVTPLGGLLFLVGWAVFAFSFLMNKTEETGE